MLEKDQKGFQRRPHLHVSLKTNRKQIWGGGAITLASSK
jgi:hypothetical protein